MKLLVLDNYDSFTWNLVQLFGAMGAEPQVYRNDALSVDQALALATDAIIVSPGPGSPADAGISIPLARAAAARRIPLLGVCLGHQALAEAFGAAIERAPALMHGKTCHVVHDGTGLFAGVPQPLTVMRYHSLAVRPGTLSPDFRTTATAVEAGGETVMAIAHRTLPLFGVQFHPESVGTVAGSQLLSNFLQVASG
ncbi:MAG TPA: aminodeoxychorismate/anthranilate synthase component II [Gemmatimonadales bacterium]|nr:aminodeoxychorismate/anthranilate synthase component II [Gemmatimonadales bacterium]